MKKQIRYGVYETNSSSTHVMTICTQKEFDDWKDGKLALEWNKFVPAPTTEGPTEEELKDYYDTYIKKEFCKEYNDLSFAEKGDVLNEYLEDSDNSNEAETYDEWYNDEYLETFEESYTTEHGDKIVVFGKYGNDY